MIKAILGYDIEPGVSPEEYERWLFEVHAPDLLANPYIDRIVFNKVLRPVTQASGGTAEIRTDTTFYRIAELHFADEKAYEDYRRWFDEHPIPVERGPAGRTAFRFYVLTESTTVERSDRP
ncbi:MAG TPA: EthD domain-containing protein [Micromonosporaceae bacterium]|nr:EthD domain-containing protein [Micromonosporaceae bacterium]